jgi:hypothetical protein
MDMVLKLTNPASVLRRSKHDRRARRPGERNRAVESESLDIGGQRDEPRQHSAQAITGSRHRFVIGE